MCFHDTININEELTYAYYRMESPCPLCECMISRFRMAQHQWSIKRKAMQDMETNSKVHYIL